MELRKVAETQTTITLGWDPPANVGGYVFYANGQVVSVATRNLKDGSPRRTVKFHKTSPGPPFQVAATTRAPAGAFGLGVGTYGDVPPPGPRLAPRAYNKGTNDSDPRFCVFMPDGTLRPGITKIGADLYVDEGNYRYNGDGLGQDGGNWRDRNRMVPNLLPSNSMDGRPVCQAYVNNGVMIGGTAGYPPESYLP